MQNENLGRQNEALQRTLAKLQGVALNAALRSVGVTEATAAAGAHGKRRKQRQRHKRSRSAVLSPMSAGLDADATAEAGGEVLYGMPPVRVADGQQGRSGGHGSRDSNGTESRARSDGAGGWLHTERRALSSSNMSLHGGNGRPLWASADSVSPRMGPPSVLLGAAGKARSAWAIANTIPEEPWRESRRRPKSSGGIWDNASQAASAGGAAGAGVEGGNRNGGAGSSAHGASPRRRSTTEATPLDGVGASGVDDARARSKSVGGGLLLRQFSVKHLREQSQKGLRVSAIAPPCTHLASDRASTPSLCCACRR